MWKKSAKGLLGYEVKFVRGRAWEVSEVLKLPIHRVHHAWPASFQGPAKNKLRRPRSLVGQRPGTPQIRL